MPPSRFHFLPMVAKRREMSDNDAESALNMGVLEMETTVNGQEHEEELELSPHNVIDKVVFGRRLRALRVLNGFDRMSDFASLLRSRYGVDVSDRTVYAIERGEQMPHLDFFVAVLALLNPDKGYFHPMLRGDVNEALKQAEQI